MSAIETPPTVEQCAEWLWEIAEAGYELRHLEKAYAIPLTEAIPNEIDQIAWVSNRIMCAQRCSRNSHPIAIKYSHPRSHELADGKKLTALIPIVAKIGGQLSPVASHDGNQGGKR